MNALHSPARRAMRPRPKRNGQLTWPLLFLCLRTTLLACGFACLPAFSAEHASAATDLSANPASSTPTSTVVQGNTSASTSAGQTAASTPPALADTSNTSSTSSSAISPSKTTAAPYIPGKAPATFVNSSTETPVGAQVGAGIFQVFLSLGLVLILLIAVAWALKRFGPQHITGGGNLRIVGGLSLGGRERVLVLEVGQQWIVIGAAPGRVNALACMPKQDELSAEAKLAMGDDAVSQKNFATWLKQMMEKRNGA